MVRISKRRAKELGIIADSGKKTSKRLVKLARPSLSLCVTVPLRTFSELNLREHWAARRRRRIQAEEAWARSVGFISPMLGPPWHIEFVRLGGRRLDPDAVASCFKAIQDAVCRWIRVDDGDERLMFAYRQEPGTGGYGVRVTITHGEAE